MSQVTITETTSETTATVEYLDDSDATLTDADTMTAGLQVNLSVGSNIVKVKVTAPDTTTTETYTVNVFRVAVPVACSTASMVNRIWTGNLTVGQSLGSTRGYSSGHGALDNRMFSFKSNAYSIDLVAVNSVGIFSFSLETATLGTDANDLILHVGTEQFALVDADIYSSGSNTYSFFTNAPHLGRRRRRLPGADGRPPGRLVGRADLRPRIRQHLRHRRRCPGDGDVRRGGGHHRHPAAGA